MGITDRMRTNARLDAGQWDAIAACQQYYGVPDRLIAKAAGCGNATVAGRRKLGGWTTRELPEGFIQQAHGMTDADGRTANGQEAPVSSSMPDDAEMDTALARLMAMMVRVTAEACADGGDAADLKRIDVLAGAVKAHEKLMELKRKVAPETAAPTPLEETQAVLAEMDRRVDELAERRARYFIGQWCHSGGCLERSGRAQERLGATGDSVDGAPDRADG